MSAIIIGILLAVSVSSIYIGWKLDYTVEEIWPQRLSGTCNAIRIIAKTAACILAALAVFALFVVASPTRPRYIDPEAWYNIMRLETWVMSVLYGIFQLFLQAFGVWLHGKWLFNRKRRAYRSIYIRPTRYRGRHWR